MKIRYEDLQVHDGKVTVTAVIGEGQNSTRQMHSFSVQALARWQETLGLQTEDETIDALLREPFPEGDIEPITKEHRDKIKKESSNGKVHESDLGAGRRTGSGDSVTRRSFAGQQHLGARVADGGGAVLPSNRRRVVPRERFGREPAGGASTEPPSLRPDPGTPPWIL